MGLGAAFQFALGKDKRHAAAHDGHGHLQDVPVDGQLRGGATPKPTCQYSNAACVHELAGESLNRSKFTKETGMTRRYRDKHGELRVSGDKKLKESQHYLKPLVMLSVHGMRSNATRACRRRAPSRLRTMLQCKQTRRRG